MDISIQNYPWLRDIRKNLISEYQVDYEEYYCEEECSEDKHEINTLREEIKTIHQTYQKEIRKLEEECQYLIDFNDENIQEMKQNQEELDKINEDNKYLILKCSLLINSREEWIGRALKLQFLFKEIEKVGLKQSEIIFEAYKDIDIPDSEVPLVLKERFIPTILTNSVEDDIIDLDRGDPDEDAF
jgi:predicted PilT family ATPase